MGSVATAFAVLEEVGRQQPVGVSDVARAVGIPKTTAHRMLQELKVLGWIRTSGSDVPRWSLTSRVLTLAGQVVAVSDVRQQALPAMHELNERTGETIHLTVPDGGFVVLLDKLDSPHPVRAWSWVGGRAPIHATSSGKSMLACLPADEVRTLLSAGLQRYTEFTHRDVDALLLELAGVRARGFALNPGEWRADVASCGAAIVNPAGRPVAALSISMPRHRFPEDKWAPYGALVREAALAVSRAG